VQLKRQSFLSRVAGEHLARSGLNSGKTLGNRIRD
jgi:hypothetical protein